MSKTHATMYRNNVARSMADHRMHVRNCDPAANQVCSTYASRARPWPAEPRVEPVLPPLLCPARESGHAAPDRDAGVRRRPAAALAAGRAAEAGLVPGVVASILASVARTALRVGTRGRGVRGHGQ